MPEVSLLHDAFMENTEMGSSSTLLTSQYKILDACGIKLPLSLNDTSTICILKTVKHALKESFIVNWKKELFNDVRKENGNKLRGYREYKNSFKKEEYLSVIQDKSVRSAFAKLRLSAHNLEIERGRYVLKKDRVTPENRICRYCDVKCCEDEIHFTLDCELYSDLRDHLFTNIDTRFPFFNEFQKQDKFIWLMANVDEGIITLVTKYIYNCFKRRNRTIHPL